jgi:hypothetical protein
MAERKMLQAMGVSTGKVGKMIAHPERYKVLDAGMYSQLKSIFDKSGNPDYRALRAAVAHYMSPAGNPAPENLDDLHKTYPGLEALKCVQNP